MRRAAKVLGLILLCWGIVVVGIPNAIGHADTLPRIDWHWLELLWRMGRHNGIEWRRF